MRLTIGSQIASVIWRKDSSTTSSITTMMFGAAKISLAMATGSRRTITVGFGVRFRVQSVFIAIGRRIVTDSGPGVRLMDGRGLVTSHGVGRLITTAAGFITTVTGPGVRAACFIAIAVGGVRHWSRFRSTFHSATTSAGTR